jgi:hypothetical protein
MSSFTKANFWTESVDGLPMTIAVTWHKYVAGNSCAGYEVTMQTEAEVNPLPVSQHIELRDAMRSANRLFNRMEKEANVRAKEYAARAVAEYRASLAAKGGAS